MPELDAPLMRFLCDSSALVERGLAVRFPLDPGGFARRAPLTGFAIRFEGTAYAYINECAHVATEMDGIKGEFFDHSGLYLMCSTHGAIYEPESGRCVGGPCRGARLKPLAVVERDGVVSLIIDDAQLPNFSPK